ncbi:WW domain-binding protein 4-like isoform X2 [Bacillus rossius redtenbacheri]|uniref:WW domain-binding protein 4-like isoform X2 n=1 Tax=Bacillus rossius redtenbacheri TaxID=93214 RepID=UPI002FDCD768
MTEYWKSQAKKYCDFCKCWIADNAPNISFHDNGRKHKENVRLRIAEMTKQSQKEYKTQLKVDDEIKKMEEAAMKAYMKDVEASADFTSKVIHETIANKQKAEEVDAPEGASEKDEGNKEEMEEEAPAVEEKKWHEAQSDEGHTYYWNVDSGESRWEPPEEGYVSSAQQKAAERRQQRREVAETRRKEAEEKKQLGEQAEEERARQEREKMKSLRKVEKSREEPLPAPAPAVVVGPAPRVDPYGSWMVVKNRPQQPIDLQLPKQEYVALKVPLMAPPEDLRTRFKEKTLSTLCDYEDGPMVGFKKRRLGSSTKKNARQRLDDD